MTSFHLSMRTWGILVVGMAGVVATATLIAMGVGGETGTLWISDVFEPLVLFASAFIFLKTAHALGWRTAGRPWFFLAGGSLAFAVGDVIWAAYELRGLEVPWPGPPDWFYVLEYPLVGIGLGVAVLSYRGIATLPRAITMATIISAVVTVGLYFWFLEPLVLSQDLTPAEAAISLFYPLADTTLALGPALAMLFVVAQLGGGRLAWPWWAIVVGVLIYGYSDAAYSCISRRADSTSRATSSTTAGARPTSSWRSGRVSRGISPLPRAGVPPGADRAADHSNVSARSTSSASTIAGSAPSRMNAVL